MDKVNEIADKDITFTINDQLFFEVLMMEIRASAIAYSINKKKTEKSREKQLYEEIKTLESNLNEENLTELEEKKEQLQQQD